MVSLGLPLQLVQGETKLRPYELHSLGLRPMEMERRWCRTGDAAQGRSGASLNMSFSLPGKIELRQTGPIGR